MEIPVPVGVLFILSGLIVNFIQAILFVLIRPFTKSLYRRINKVVAELLWLELIWLIDWWAGIKKPSLKGKATVLDWISNLEKAQ